MTTPTLKLSDLAGPDASGFSDVAVIVRADGSESEPFVIKETLEGTACVYGPNMTERWYFGTHAVRRLGRGRLVPARIEMEGEATPESKLREAIRDAGFAVMQTSGKWSLVMVTDEAKRRQEVDDRHTAQIINENIDLRRKLAEAGVEGSPPPGGQGTIPQLMSRAQDAEAKVRLMREALGDLLLSADASWEEHRLGHDWAEYCTAARATLAATAPKPTEARP